LNGLFHRLRPIWFDVCCVIKRCAIRDIVYSTSNRQSSQYQLLDFVVCFPIINLVMRTITIPRELATVAFLPALRYYAFDCVWEFLAQHAVDCDHHHSQSTCCSLVACLKVDVLHQPSDFFFVRMWRNRICLRVGDTHSRENRYEDFFHDAFRILFHCWHPRQESNLYLWLRTPAHYPLDYVDEFTLRRTENALMHYNRMPSQVSNLAFPLRTRASYL
jgi:hypothetical protein